MKKFYEEPVMKTVKFENVDVITASVNNADVGNPDQSTGGEAGNGDF